MDLKDKLIKVKEKIVTGETTIKDIDTINEIIKDIEKIEKIVENFSPELNESEEMFGSLVQPGIMIDTVNIYFFGSDKEAENEAE